MVRTATGETSNRVSPNKLSNIWHFLFAKGMIRLLQDIFWSRPDGDIYDSNEGDALEAPPSPSEPSHLWNGK